MSDLESDFEKEADATVMAAEMEDAKRPRPFVRWAGGKRRLLPELCKRIPKTWDREHDLYVEPFLGAGALFWELRPRWAVLSDFCGELMNVWNVVRCDVGGLVGRLEEHREAYAGGSRGYYEIERAVVYECKVREAARTIFLNKTCFNGLYRLNQEGKFNVPWGRRKGFEYDADNLRRCSTFLQGSDVELREDHFLDLLNELPDERGPGVYEGALVYLDPPYMPTSKTSCFTRYCADGFGLADQLILAGMAKWLVDFGAHVILSQSADARLADLYRSLGFRCDPVTSSRLVGARASSREELKEYIVCGSPR